MIEQQAQSTPSYQLLEIQELASIHRLGALVAEYKGGFSMDSIRGIVSGVLLVIVSVVTVIELFITTSHIFDFSVFFVVLSPFVMFILGVVILGLSISRPLLRRRSWHVYVFDHGFIFTKGKQLDIFRWEEIRAVWWKERRRSRESTPGLHKYTIERLDGHRIVLDNKIRKVKELGTTIGEQVTNVLWPQTLAVYNAGNIVHFGPLSVNQQGVSKGNKFLPWSTLTKIAISNEVLEIRQDGKWLSWYVRLEDIPNVLLLLKLSRFVRGR